MFCKLQMIQHIHHVSKYNSKSEEQVILLIIPNKEG